MIELTDQIWKRLKGGYKSLYDASVPLKKLEIAKDSETINKLWLELWSELHHQGDVGLASYLSLPQLVRICKLKNLYSPDLLDICCTIEQQRHLGNNPKLPDEFHNYYSEGLTSLKQFVLNHLDNNLDHTTFTLSLATLATCNGQIELGKAILELDDKDVLNELLSHF